MKKELVLFKFKTKANDNILNIKKLLRLILNLPKLMLVLINNNNYQITFIDTVGREAFLMGNNNYRYFCFSCYDNIMPQTREVIAYAQKDKSPIIVFINKIDKPNVLYDKIINPLVENNPVSEKWGEILLLFKDHLKNKGIKQLLESIARLADVLELKTNANWKSNIPLETNIDKGLGPVATLIDQIGTIKKMILLLSVVLWKNLFNA